MNAPTSLPGLRLPAEGEQWLEMLALAARHYGLPASTQRARLAGAWDGGATPQHRIAAIARASGLSIRLLNPGELQLSSRRLPVIASLADGGLVLISALDGAGNATCTFSREAGLQSQVALSQIEADVSYYILPRPAQSARDVRVDAYIRPYETHWLRRILMRDAGAYRHVAIASTVTNCLGFAGVIFSMQVYDRVVPAQSMPTLYILFIGVILAVGFDFALRRKRVDIIDVLGKRADLRISDQVFGHAMRVRNRMRPTSTGTFISQLRDLDQVRDLLTSTTVAALADLPFFVLFLVIYWFIGGPLVLVPIVGVILLVVPGLLAQRRLRALATESMRESSLRNAMLVEAVQGIEDIKALQAEDRFQRQWNHYNAVAGEAQLKLRDLTNSLGNWTQSVQSAIYATVIFAGAPMVISGDLTTGALVAASILGSRMMAPMSQVTTLLSRYQHAMIAMGSLDQIMALPVDAPEAEHRIPLPIAAGRFTLRSAVFGYADPNAPPALRVPQLEIRAGEKVALLGRNGAGKSTLLQGLSGMLQPVSGEVLLDDLALAQIDPADVRRHVGLLTQNSRLFHGTVRENLTLGAPNASDEEILSALAMVSAVTFVRRLRNGLEHVVLEGGLGLSGGQVQSLLLARLLLRQPNIVLLDEPTAAMDEGAERHFIAQFAQWSVHRTAVIATHRMRVLDLVDRILVIDNGTLVLDQPRDAALQTMRAGGRAA